MVDAVPHLKRQVTPPAAASHTTGPELANVTYQASERIGRLPLIGVDSGALPGTCPDRDCFRR